MPRFLPLRIGLYVMLGCGPPAYVPPTENEPHAILKVRHVVHRRAGPNYGTSVRLGEFAIDERSAQPIGNGGEIIHLRIRPESAPLRISGSSYHYEQRMVTKYRTVNESYMCSQYSCTGYGTNRSCGSHMTTCHRTRQESHQEMDTVLVTDDACSASTWVAPRTGGVYLVQFDYLGENQCTVACYEQTPTGFGQFDLSPCPAAAPTDVAGS